MPPLQPVSGLLKLEFHVALHDPITYIENMKKASVVMLLLCISIAMFTVHVTVIQGSGQETVMTIDVCNTAMDLVFDSAPTVPETVYDIPSIQPSEDFTENIPPGAMPIFTSFIDKPPEA